MTDPSPDSKKRWRDDPLSVFLAFGAVLLGGMYFLEERDIATLEQASARAQALAAQTDLPGCTFGSASTDGTTLVVACDGTAATAAQQAATKLTNLTGFSAVMFSGSDGLLACSARPSTWPNGCESKPKPDPQSLQE